MKKSLALILNNIRSTHNVGSILRTAEGMGVNHVYLSGYTPYPMSDNDERLPHLAKKISAQIHKTALGAEDTVVWSYERNVRVVFEKLKKQGYLILALEQTSKSVRLGEFRPKAKTALVLGSEIKGIDASLLKTIDIHLEIPMVGKKESYNVAVAAAIALYHLKFIT